MDNVIITTIAEKYKSIQPFFDERSKRVWATAESIVHAAPGMGYLILKKGFAELGQSPSAKQRIRQSGGGRKKKTETGLTVRCVEDKKCTKKESK
jgi:hypothetical protein